MLATEALEASTSGQQLAYRQLQDIAGASHGTFEILTAFCVEGWKHLFIQVSVDVGRPGHVIGGLRLRQREKLLILVDPNFPYVLPRTRVGHSRFAGFSHVYWGHELCLYQAPDTEYNPSEGMFGYLHRLLTWLGDASNNNLDPPAQPLHPPTASVDVSLPISLVAQQDTPSFEGDHWFGFAKLRQITDARLDLVGWVELGDLTASDRNDFILYPAFLTKGTMPHYYPKKGAEIIGHLEALGCPRSLLFGLLRLAALVTPAEKPFCLIFGCAMRGRADDRRQHLTAWYVEPMQVGMLRLSLERGGEDAERAELGELAERVIHSWLDDVNVSWCWIMENRKEIVVSRQDQTPATAFVGLRVAIWGCGALGSHVATYLAQAEVAELHLVDNKPVKPGLLGRQLFDDNDIRE